MIPYPRSHIENGAHVVSGGDAEEGADGGGGGRGESSVSFARWVRREKGSVGEREREREDGKQASSSFPPFLFLFGGGDGVGAVRVLPSFLKVSQQASCIKRDRPTDRTEGC